MSKTLVIAEKPSVAADIAKVVGANEKSPTHYEGDSWVVSWAIGHVLEMAPPEKYDEKYKRWVMKELPILPSKFIREPVNRTKKQLSALKKLLKRKDIERVMNGCDAGREGELIFREIYEHAASKKPVDRLWLQSMTAQAIEEAIAHPRSNEDVQGLADAAYCRSEADWLVGMNLSRAATSRLRTKKDRSVWSGGRVQTPALAMVVGREREILQHEPQPYWLLKAKFKVETGEAHEYEGTWHAAKGGKQSDRILDEATRDELLAKVKAATGATATETRKDRKQTAPPLFDLTSLQREANRRHGYSARRTLQAAQELYESHKLVTYPRTDSKALPEDYREHVKAALETLSKSKTHGPHAKRLLADGLQNQKRNFNDKEISDHFAIVPTGEPAPADLGGVAKQVFDLIVRRFLAAFHPPAVSAEVERFTVVEGETFRTKRTVLTVPGWQACWEKDKKDAAEALPPLPGDGSKPCPVAPVDVETEEKETKPPARLTEATLLNLMELAGKDVDDRELSKILHDAGGIGTPATRADIIETLLAREYIDRCVDLGNRKSLRATARGIRLIEVLERLDLPRLVSSEMTAHLEDSLRAVERGEKKRADYMKEIHDLVKQFVDALKNFEFPKLFEGTEPLGPCPACGAPVHERLRVFDCEKGGLEGECNWVLWKDISGRFVDRRSARQLITDRETPPKAGFFSRQGREYEAMFVLDENNETNVKPRSADGIPELSDAAATPLDIGPCPFHPDKLVKRSPQGYRCELHAAKECALSLPLVLCHRPFTPEEIAQLTSAEKKVGPFENFISKRGRPFTATLTLGDNARISWEFPPRGEGRKAAKVKRKEFPVNPEPLGKCPKHPKADVVETACEFKCTEAGCKLEVPREFCKREITREEMLQFLKNKGTEVLEGWISKRGKTFSAALKLNMRKRGGFEFDFAD